MFIETNGQKSSDTKVQTLMVWCDQLNSSKSTYNGKATSN